MNLEENQSENIPTEMAGPARSAETARALIRKTKRATRRRFPVEEKVRIVMEGVRGDSLREATREEVKTLRQENERLKQWVADLSVVNMLLKESQS